MTNILKTKSHSPTGESGMTILEVLVAMTIFIVISGSIFGLLKVAQTSRTAVTNNVQLTKSLRIGLNLIGRDTYNAGLGYPLQTQGAVLLKDNRIASIFGVPADSDTGRDTLPPIIAGNNLTLNTFNSASNVKTDQVTFVFKDVSFNQVGTGTRLFSQKIGVSSYAQASGVDQLTLPSGGTSKCAVNDVFVVAGSSGSYTLGMVTGISGNVLNFANGDRLGLNNPTASGEMKLITPVSILRVKVVTYFVTADGVLTRREYGNVAPPDLPATGYIDEPLVYGVEDFQIKYVMDSGAVLDNPSAGPDGIAGNADDDQTAQAAVRQVRITIKAKTTEVDAKGSPVEAIQSATFATRNLGYDAN